MQIGGLYFDSDSDASDGEDDNTQDEAQGGLPAVEKTWGDADLGIEGCIDEIITITRDAPASQKKALNGLDRFLASGEADRRAGVDGGSVAGGDDAIDIQLADIESMYIDDGAADGDEMGGESYAAAGGKVYKDGRVVVDDIHNAYKEKDYASIKSVYPPYSLIPSREAVGEMIDYTSSSWSRVEKIRENPVMKFVIMVSALVSTDHSRFIDTAPSTGIKSGVISAAPSLGGGDLFGSFMVGGGGGGPGGPQGGGGFGLGGRPSTRTDTGFLFTPPNAYRRSRRVPMPSLSNNNNNVAPSSGTDSESKNTFPSEKRKRKNDGGKESIYNVVHQPAPQNYVNPTEQWRHKPVRYSSKILNDYLEHEDAKKKYPHLSGGIDNITGRENQANLEGFLNRPEVTGVVYLKDIFVGTLHAAYDLVVSEYTHLSAASVEVFMTDPVASPKFAQFMAGYMLSNAHIKGNRTSFHDSINWAYRLMMESKYMFGFMTYDARRRCMVYNPKKRAEAFSSPTTSSGVFLKPTGMGFVQ
jgi:hypothetical protein